jgi:probable F420-dependent oxidoreductase
MELGRIGIWSWELRALEGSQAADTTAELEELGYGAMWVPGGFDESIFDDAARLLEGGSSIPIVTGIVSIWAVDAPRMAERFSQVNSASSGRFKLGLGVSHSAVVDAAEAGKYKRPYSKMVAFLDELDGVPPDDMVLAALGPKMLRLSADLTAGAHPYFVTTHHTAAARAELGDGPLLAPEQAVVLNTDADEARRIARDHMAMYLTLPNYTNNLRNYGFDDADFADGGSDRVVDAVVAWGDVDAIGARIQTHWDAGADHVGLQVLSDAVGQPKTEEWRTLAALTS